MQGLEMAGLQLHGGREVSQLGGRKLARVAVCRDRDQLCIEGG
jgi:hypothetical protein